MNKIAYKNKVYGELAEIAKSLANPIRLKILNLLSQGSYSVENIANNLNVSTANASQHLQTLKKSRLVGTLRTGHYIHYHLTGNRVYELWKALRDFGVETNAEIKATMYDFKADYFQNVKYVSIEQIKEMDLSELDFLDVRPVHEHEQLSIKGSKCIPVNRLSENLHLLSKNKRIIVYCRGSLCVFADEAVQFLRTEGFDALKLENDILDWKLNQMPLN